MAALIKELLFDLNDLDVITRVDLLAGLESLCRDKTITYHQIDILNLYFSGYSIEELERVYDNAAEQVVHVLYNLEQRTGYTDDMFLQLGLAIYPKKKKIAESLRKRLDAYGRDL